MRFKQLEYALEVAQTNSLSKASDNLFITKIALSESIIQLEKELGFPVFERSRTGMYPTENGRTFLKDAYNILRIASSWDALRFNESNSSELKIAISYAIFPMVSDLIEKLVLPQQHLSLSLKEYGAGEILKVLPQNENMIAICSVVETISWPNFVEFEKKNPDWNIVALGEDEFVLAVSKSHDIAKREMISLEECASLRNELNMVLLSWDKNALFNKLKCCEGTIALTLTNREKVISMVTAGHAISLFPQRVMEFEMMKNENLDYVKVDAYDMRIKYFLIYNTHVQMDTQKNTVIDALKEMF